MNVVLTWVPPLEQRRSNLRAFMETGVYESIGVLAHEAKEQLLTAMQAFAPVRTGAFRDSLRATQQVQGKAVKVSILGASPLGTFITKGTAPHVIEPRNGQFLRFESRNGGVVFARRVNHPGTQPNPFDEKALEDVTDQLYSRAADWGRGIVAILRQP